MEAPGIDLTELARRIEEEPTSFGFFQAVRVLERLMPEREPVGGFGNPAREVVRFGVNPAIGFPASEIASLALPEDGPARMVVNFLGLTGPQGVLPLHYGELVAQRTRAKDTALRDFLDLFHHRIASLFYRAWARHRPGDAGLEERLLDLLGLGTPHLDERLTFPAARLSYYAGLLGAQHRSAVVLEKLIEDFFGVPVRVEQFVGGWYPLDVETQCALGGEDDAANQLGLGAVVGDEVWDPQARARIRIGPLERARYEQFLPGGPAFDELRALTEFFAGGHYDLELQLVLKREDVSALRIDSDAPATLGWGTWLQGKPLARDPDDVLLTLHQQGSRS